MNSRGFALSAERLPNQCFADRLRPGSDADRRLPRTGASVDSRSHEAQDPSRSSRWTASDASTSGRMPSDWADREQRGLPYRARTPSGWSREMEPSRRPNEARRRQNSDGFKLQRGPVQPAVWTDQQPGTRSKRNREAVPEPAITSSESRTRDLRGAESRDDIEEAGEIDQRRSPGEVRHQRAAPRRFREPFGPAEEPMLSDGRTIQEATDPGSGQTRFSTASARPDRRANSVQGNGNMSRGRDRFMGLWGRRASDGSASKPSSRPLPDTADDWVEDGVLRSEAEDGWGGPSTAPFRPSPSDSNPPREEGEAAASTMEPEEPVPEMEAPNSDGEEESPPEVEDSIREAELLEEPPEPEGEDPEDDPFPDITLLAPSEVDDLVPIVPSAEQMGASWGSATEVWQRLGAAAFLTIVTAKLNLVLFASGSATYPLWGPAALAANRNRQLRQGGRHMGFWRTNILEVRVERPERRRYTDRTVAGPLVTRPTVRFLLGDDSGARSQLSLPFNRRYEQIQVGEPAELLVLSSHSRFSSFKALKEIYLPVSGLWLSEYPHLNRNLFLDISLDIERARKQEMMEGAVEAFS